MAEATGYGRWPYGPRLLDTLSTFNPPTENRVRMSPCCDSSDRFRDGTTSATLFLNLLYQFPNKLLFLKIRDARLPCQRFESLIMLGAFLGKLLE